MFSNTVLLMAVRDLWVPGQLTIPFGVPLYPVAMGRLEEATYEVASCTHIQFCFIAV